MRFGMLVGAAILAGSCTGQAIAARYYEFQIGGDAPVTYFDPFGVQPPVSFTRASLVTASFDITDASPRASFDEVTIFLSSAGLSTINSPSGVKFSFSFNLNGIASGPDFQPFSAAGTYTYLNCSNRYRVCTDTHATLLSLKARASDIAPAFLGASELVQFFPVPEPTSWAMMIVGLGAIGGTLRRRTRVAVSFG